MKINTILKILMVFLLTNLAVSCVKDTDYELPNTTITTPEFDGSVRNIDDIISSATKEVTEYQNNDALEGYVISSDEGGNFYKKIYVETADKKHGFKVALDKGGLYSEFPFGAKVQVRLKGMSVQLVDGQLEVGYKTYTSKNGRVSVGSAPASIYNNHVYNLQEDLKTKESLAKSSTSVKNLKVKDNVNLLLTFENVYFEDKAVGKTYHVKENDKYAGTNYNLIDSEGNKIPFRTSKFAKFKDEKVPAGLLNVTGILTTYNGSYQFLVNNTDDIIVVGEAPETSGSTGGNDDIVLTVPTKENFDKELPKSWKTVAVKGKRVWEKKDRDGVNYMQMSAYSKESGVLDVETWLITPKINLGEIEDNILKIKLADAFQNGNPLHIMCSSDYDGGNNPKSATWKEIGEETVKALINNSKIYDNKYEESKAIKIPAKGEVYIAFVYDSKGSISTTVQLENVSVTKGEATDNGTSPSLVNAEVKSIADIRSMFNGTAATISENYAIEGVVISDRSTENIYGNNVVIQDETAGIVLRFKGKHDLNLGQKVKVTVKGAELSDYGGLLQVNKLENTAVLSKEDATLPEAKLVTIKDVLDGKHQSQLVKIEGVQFKEITKNYSGINILTDCTAELTTYVRKEATFANEKVNGKRGGIIGYVSVNRNTPQLIFNKVSDINFTENYKDCSAGSTNDNSGEDTTADDNTDSTGVATFKFDFENIQDASNNSYSVTETLKASDNKTTLVFKGRTDMDKFAINGKGVMMKDKGFIKITFTKGIKTLKFKYRAAFTSKTERKIFVLEGDENSKVILKEVKFDKDVTSETFTLNLNKTESYTLTIKAGGKQVVIDDIEWTE